MTSLSTTAIGPAIADPTQGLAAERPHPHHRRAMLVRWIRKTHGWIGLWGAILGLIFGTAGIWLNHRAVLKLPMSQQRANAQLALPDPAPASAQEMAAWLQTALGMDAPPNSIRTEPSRPVAWTEKGRHAGASESADAAAPKPLMQPERWIFNFGGPDAIVQADYWRGNRSVGVTTTSNGFVATLANLHKGVGMPVAWILLVDTLAGSLIFLSVSGVALWMLTHRRRVVGLVIFGTSAALTLGLILSRL
ncbi:MULTISPECIES: PepSY-associated TM helix domain-containing protein [unclassified Variovorax]|uniref:PepSY-associated TM helix domain-containing protein n=1 Tax=unclassified Variovorax TaxID=663243 RepID=UPI00131844AA|nr:MULTISPECIES: PepSY-associated TM helix domain-containing protein [unclassified Variovorax]VTU15099.1 putative iron-regulated membrane protein [Variovorax sp. SRS16]VTU22602.1 putative iron-regulated membrane protein [Variovorax sp. PBL-E5]